MIPASYMFKDIYQRNWEEPDAPVVIERPHRSIDGLLRPLTGAVAGLFRRPARAHGRTFAGHAYE